MMIKYGIMSSLINMFISLTSLDSQGMQQSTQCGYVSNSSWSRAGCLLLVYIIGKLRHYVTTFHMIYGMVIRIAIANPVPQAPESKNHYRSPTVAGIGINISSLYIPPSQFNPKFFSTRFFLEFFSSGSCLKFFFSQNHLKFFNPVNFSGMDRGGNFSHQTLGREYG